MSTTPTSVTLDTALAGIPASFRKKIIETYTGLRSAYIEGKHDACGLRAGHFAESALRLLQQEVTGAHTKFGTRIRDFTAECLKLENTPAIAGHESLRIVIPRALNFLYALRNKRGIGHVGGEVNANLIDAATAVRTADWCVCELVRLFHGLSLEEAQAMLDAISVRQIPQVWSVGGKRRVLDKTLDFRSRTLLLLYTDSDSAVTVEDLFDWTEHSHLPNYKRVVLQRLHDSGLVEYDRDTQTVVISPTGAQDVEERVLPKLVKPAS